mmetsp:Transcript_8970/g.23118  ORF Transcript_8970/g.23118 Transcript_8970/m.23118 type:complete len:323 (-) Transcript_8970:1238-2206(-)
MPTSCSYFKSDPARPGKVKFLDVPPYLQTTTVPSSAAAAAAAAAAPPGFLADVAMMSAKFSLAVVSVFDAASAFTLAVLIDAVNLATSSSSSFSRATFLAVLSFSRAASALAFTLAAALTLISAFPFAFLASSSRLVLASRSFRAFSSASRLTLASRSLRAFSSASRLALASRSFRAFSSASKRAFSFSAASNLDFMALISPVSLCTSSSSSLSSATLLFALSRSSSALGAVVGSVEARLVEPPSLKPPCAPTTGFGEVVGLAGSTGLAPSGGFLTPLAVPARASAFSFSTAAYGLSPEVDARRVLLAADSLTERDFSLTPP